MNKICVIGSLNMDLVIQSPKQPIMGETLMGSGFFTTQGGKGANQAVAIGKLGGNVSMIGCIGDDDFGKQLKENLIDNNINAEAVKIVENISSGVAVITVVDGNNCIIVDPGANNELTNEVVKANEQKIIESQMIVLQMEIPFESILEAVKIAKRNGVKVLLNPAPARSLPDSLLRDLDIITPNETECEIITGIKIDSIEAAKTAVKLLIQKGVKQVFITMGEKGVVYNDGDIISHKSPPKTVAVDSTAAGDSFTAAIALKLTEGCEIEEAVRFANQVGALTVSKKGAQSSLPTLDEVVGSNTKAVNMSANELDIKTEK